MAEPDTLQHFQIKHEIKEVKAEVHFDMQQELKNQGKSTTLVPWDPCELVRGNPPEASAQEGARCIGLRGALEGARCIVTSRGLLDS